MPPAYFETYDMFLTPTNPTLPLLHSELTPTADNVAEVWQLELASGCFTILANVTGLPAMSVPLHWSDEGLPIGCHFMSGPGREDLLLRLAGQLEQAQPWAGRWPAITDELLAGG